MLGLAVISGLGVISMMLITCVDVIGRFFRKPLTGAVDLVQIAGAVAISCALPYTTAVKGHVAVEFFFQKLGRRGRILVDTLARLVAASLFSVFSWRCVLYGISLRRSGEVSPTLQLPTYPYVFLTAFACAVVVLVIIHNLLHPGKEMIKP